MMTAGISAKVLPPVAERTRRPIVKQVRLPESLVSFTRMRHESSRCRESGWDPRIPFGSRVHLDVDDAAADRRAVALPGRQAASSSRTMPDRARHERRSKHFGWTLRKTHLVMR